MVRIEQNDTEATPVEESETKLWTGVQFPPSPLQQHESVVDIPLRKARQRWWAFLFCELVCFGDAQKLNPGIRVQNVDSPIHRTIELVARVASKI